MYSVIVFGLSGVINLFDAMHTMVFFVVVSAVPRTAVLRRFFVGTFDRTAMMTMMFLAVIFAVVFVVTMVALLEVSLGGFLEGTATMTMMFLVVIFAVVFVVTMVVPLLRVLFGGRLYRTTMVTMFLVMFTVMFVMTMVALLRVFISGFLDGTTMVMFPFAVRFMMPMVIPVMAIPVTTVIAKTAVLLIRILSHGAALMTFAVTIMLIVRFAGMAAEVMLGTFAVVMVVFSHMAIVSGISALVWSSKADWEDSEHGDTQKSGEPHDRRESKGVGGL